MQINLHVRRGYVKLYKYPSEKDKMPEGNYYLYMQETTGSIRGWLKQCTFYKGHIDAYAKQADRALDIVSFCYGPVFDPSNLPDPRNLKTKIVSAFPGTGKSYFFREVADKVGLRVLDSDSSGFSWITSVGTTGESVKIRNPEFPANYIKHIKENMGEVDIIFVSSHKEVREALVAEGLEFFLVYPWKEYKDEYIKRYTERGNPKEFIATVGKNWDMWIDELEKFKPKGVTHIELWHEYLADHAGRILS
jgi:hypothetical protein